MNRVELDERFAADSSAGALAGAVLSWSREQPCLEVAAASWLLTARALRDDWGYGYFDWLSAVDEVDELAVVLCVGDLRPGVADQGRDVDFLLVRTRLPSSQPRLASLAPVFPGAGWHERETHEMFGVGFDDHPGLTPLLLPDGFEGRPLRKDFVLAARVARPWPGAKEPGESAAEASRAPRGRRRTVAPGLPDPAWGPRPPGDATAGRE